ncbi:hypothetical protein J4377_11665 [Halomonas sp. XH26]|uniref:hypothetical protein n=1 Tax=Halomonas sp. XH26 TaxID=2557993 RepID=UPI00209DB819|nr:hypothetical protein [Halomonas sp. XH26]UTA78623.1 hypothetical protein J4377_11665 [Halomonas sp. XH26]
MSFFCITSNERKSNSYFDGYAFADRSLVMNYGGYEKYKKEKGSLFDNIEDGRFLLFEKNGDAFRLRADPAGQYIIYYYKQDDFWAISDSLLKISEVIANSGLKRKVYQPSVDVFKNERLSLIGGQLVSNNTALKNVKTLGLDEYIELSWVKVENSFSIKKIPKKKSYTDYEELLCDLVSSWRGRLGAISKMHKESYLALSGGVDSRAILALWENSLADKKINCHSHKKYETEYEIAKKLCVLSSQNFGSGMKGLSSTALSAEDSYLLSMSANASIKTNFGFRRNAIKDPQFHFIGGCAIGSFYMKSSYKARAERLIKQFGEAGENVGNEILLSLKSLGIDRKDPWAMFHHYYNFRARYHYGNEVYTRFGSIQVQPLLDSRLHQIPLLTDKEYVEGNGVVRDIISVASGNLLNVPFDTPDKVKVKKPKFTEKLSKVEGEEYTCFYGDVDKTLNFKGAGEALEANWYGDIKNILANKKKVMTEVALDLGFDDSYIKQAVNEIDSFNKGSKLRKSGVLLGVCEIFNS